MKKRSTIFKILLLVVVLVVGLFSFTGCGKIKYGATLYSHAEKFLTQEFLKENRVKAYYPNENYVEGESEPNDIYIHDKTSPSSRTIIVTDKQEYDKIVTQSPCEVDFENEMIIIYIFGDCYVSREYNLKKLNVNNEILTIHYKLQIKSLIPIGDASQPYQRCFMLKMKKIEISNIEFIEMR